jgi:hypothetical protein
MSHILSLFPMLSAPCSLPLICQYSTADGGFMVISQPRVTLLRRSAPGYCYIRPSAGDSTQLLNLISKPTDETILHTLTFMSLSYAPCPMLCAPPLISHVSYLMSPPYALCSMLSALCPMPSARCSMLPASTSPAKSRSGFDFWSIQAFCVA